MGSNSSKRPMQETPQLLTKDIFATQTASMDCVAGENTDPIGPKIGPIQMFIALYDYESSADQDLSLTKGDEIIIVNNQDKYWWQARCVSSGREGYIPSNLLAPMGSIRSREWFFGQIDRSAAEQKLLSPENAHGTFLIIESTTLPRYYSLSIRDQDSVKHYRITELDAEGFFIAVRGPFATLDELVTHYTTNADGLCSRLSNVCTKDERPPTEGLSHMNKDMLEFDRSLLKLRRKLGPGSFGEVWEGACYYSSKVAIKIFRPGTIRREDLLAAAAIMKKLHHENLIQLYGVCTMEEPFYIVTEYMHRRSLLDFLQNGDGCKLKEPELIDIGMQVASGMAYLELHHYIHGDLAARNVLVGENLQIKVTDFGLARVIEQDICKARTKARFPIKWTAPEAALDNRFTIKSDVWSFGIVLMEIITFGHIPCPGMTNAQVLAKVMSSSNYLIPKPPNTPDLLYQIMLNCWDTNEYSRPTFEYLKYQLIDFYTESGRIYRWGKYPG